MKTEYYLFLILTIASILSQIPHAYYTFNSFSKLKDPLKVIQSVVFCSILSVAIFSFVWIGKLKLALLGALIEIIINLYYYSMEFWSEGYGQKKLKFKSTLTFWRKNWIAIFFGLLLPLLIYVFAEQMKGLV